MITFTLTLDEVLSAVEYDSPLSPHDQLLIYMKENKGLQVVERFSGIYPKGELTWEHNPETRVTTYWQKLEEYDEYSIKES